MMKLIRIVFLSAILICMLAMPVMANYSSNGWPVETRVNGTVNGGVFHDSIGWSGATTQTLGTDVPNGTVKYAYLYTGVWGNGVSKDGWVNVAFNGDYTSNKLGPIHLEGDSDSNDNVWCSGLGKYWIWYDVTNLVNTGQINTATTSRINGTIDGRVYGIVLVVVYEGGDDPKQIQYWINDGSKALSSDNPTEMTNFVGTVSTDNVAMVNLTTVHLTGYDPICNNCTKFNDNELNTSCINTNFFDMHTWDVTDFMDTSENDAYFSRGYDSSVNICNAILTVEYETEPNAPDLKVTDILVNSGGTRDSILRVYVNQSNNISAVVHNNGPVDVTDDFDVCFEADGVNIGCATVTGGLYAGANTTISIDWTPTCADYSVMPGFPPQSLPLTINVTVDCNCSNCPTCPDENCGTIIETDETNNTLSKIIPAMQVYDTRNVIGGVVNNGYTSKNFDCNTTEEPLDQFKYYNLIGGGVEYNVSGAKISSFNPEATDTRIHHIDLPSGATVKNARLYVYWYDKWGNSNTYPIGCLANLNVNFSGTDLIPDATYQDSKAFGYYQSPKGNSVFNITSLVSGSGDYTAIVKNMEPVGGNGTSLLGEMLVVIYDDADHGHEVQIWMLEGTDYLMAADNTHGSKDFSVSPEEATATVSFLGGTIDPANVNTARLITIVAQGMEPETDMLFNGNIIKTDAWDTATEAYPDSKINIENVSVKSNLSASGNNMGFQDKGTTGMQASNVILIVEETTSLPDLIISNIYPQYMFTNLTNVLSVNVTNQGTASTSICNVNITITHTGGPTVLTATVPALDAGESVLVEVGNWKPTVLENISMTAFADSSSAVDESANECNNELTVFRNTTGNCAVDDMLPDTCFGYRGNNPLTTAYEGTGGVIYSVGDFKYKNNTVNFSIGASGDENLVDGSTADIPDSATIKNATLYVYYTYRKSVTGPNSGADPRPDYEISINDGSILTTDEYYTDIKGFTSSEYQYGTLVYDVTADVSGDGTYQAVRSNCNNTDPILKGKGYVSGMALMIIYDGGSDNTYAISHGYDRLATFYKIEYKVIPEDATTTATLTDVNPDTIEDANLFTVTVDAVASGSESQQFNTRSWEEGAWDCVSGVPECNYKYPLGINRGIVDKSDITASGTDELVKFQERASNGFGAVFACLQTRINDTKPTISSVTLNDTVVQTGTTIEVNVSATDENIIANVKADGNLLTLTDGYYIGTITACTSPVTVIVTNEAGNIATDTSATYTIDDTKPSIISVTLNDTVVQNGTTIEVNVSAIDENVIASVTADGNLLKSTTGEYYVGTITACTSPVTVMVTDESGNIATDTSAAYTIDNKLPEVSITEPLQNMTIRFVDNIVKGDVSDDNFNSAMLIVRDNTSTIVCTYDLIIIDDKFIQRVEYAPEQNNTLELIAIDEAGNSNNDTVLVSVQNNTMQVDCNVNESQPVYIDAVNETDTGIEFYSNVSANVTFTVTAITNETMDDLNVSAFAAFGEMAVGKIVEINVTGLDATNESEVRQVFVKLYYTLYDLDTDGDGTVELGELDEDNMFVYWYDSGNWTKLLKDNPDWVIDNGQVKISGDNPGYVWVNVKHLSMFGLVALPLSESSDNGDDDKNNVVRKNTGSSVVVRSGSSGEANDNIALKEFMRKYIGMDTKVIYQFEDDANSVESITFDAKTNAGYVVAIIEVLKDTSALVSSAPSGEVYQHMNILVGNSEYATERNIANPVIGFKVARSWIAANNIDESTIRLNRYSNENWNQLATSRTGEDTDYLYFESVTSGFSPFAITAEEKVDDGNGIVAETVTDVEQITEEKTQTLPEEEPGIPGFSLSVGLLGLLIAVQLLRKSKY